MKTASFFTYTGPGRIAITRGSAPRSTPSGYRYYRALAPTWGMLKLSYQKYRIVYFAEVLGRLDPATVMGDLERLAEGHEPVLLCFERPPFTETNWCHRRMAGEWFADSLEIDVPEIDTRDEMLL